MRAHSSVLGTGFSKIALRVLVCLLLMVLVYDITLVWAMSGPDVDQLTTLGFLRRRHSVRARRREWRTEIVQKISPLSDERDQKRNKYVSQVMAAAALG